MARNFSRPLGRGEDGGEGPAAPQQRQQSALLAEEPHGQAGAAGGNSLGDEWVYLDPQGVVQGPFAKQDIIEWHEGGFFPIDLQVRHAKEPQNAPFRALGVLLHIWGGHPAPPGFGSGAPAAPAQPAAAPAFSNALPVQQQQQRQQQLAPRAPPVVLPDHEELMSASLQQLALDPVVTLPAPAASAAVRLQPAPLVAPHLAPHLAPQAAPPLLPAAHALHGLPPGGALTALSAFHQANQLPQAPAVLQEDALLPHLHQPVMQQQPQAPMQPLVQLQQMHSHPSLGQPLQQLASNSGRFAGRLAGEDAGFGMEAASWGGAHTLPPAPLPPPPQPPLQRMEPPVPPAAPAPAAPSLMDIQREQENQRRQQAQEAQRRREAEALRQQQLAAAEAEAMAAAPADHFGGGDSGLAPWAAASQGPRQATGAKSLLEIQREEAQRAARAAEEEAAYLAAAPPGVAASGWAKVARGNISGGSGAMSLREIQAEEERRAAASGPAAASSSSKGGWGGGAAQPEEEELFWDYGPAAAQPTPPPAPPPKPAASKPASAWAAAAGTSTAQAPPPPAPRAVRPPAAPPARTNSAASAAAAATPRPAPAPAAPAPAAASDLTPEEVAAISEALSDSSSALTGPFRDWCREQMQVLTGSADVALCEFLLTLDSNSELAEYAALYLGGAPAVARFSAEFIRRKQEAKAAAAAAGNAKKSRKARAKATALAAAAAAPPAAPRAPGAAPWAKAAAKPAAPAAPAGPPGYVPEPAARVDLAAAAAAVGKEKPGDWEKVPKPAGGAKKKKGGKGAKLDMALLGFSSGTNYSLLNTDD